MQYNTVMVLYYVVSHSDGTLLCNVTQLWYCIMQCNTVMVLYYVVSHSDGTLSCNVTQLWYYNMQCNIVMVHYYLVSHSDGLCNVTQLWYCIMQCNTVMVLYYAVQYSERTTLCSVTKFWYCIMQYTHHSDIAMHISSFINITVLAYNDIIESHLSNINFESFCAVLRDIRSGLVGHQYMFVIIYNTRRFGQHTAALLLGLGES